MMLESFPFWTLVSFIGVVVIYWRVWRPFMALPCHQDAGWHAYWAALRHQGVSLQRQENILMGCARLGNMFLYVLWFALFGKGDPDLMSRKAYRVLNIITALLLALTVYRYSPDGGAAGLLMAMAFLVLMSIPTLGIHYETTERSVLLLNIGVFALALEILGGPSESTYMLLGVLVFLQISTALLFKITQLGEYFFIWLAVYLSTPTLEGFVSSFVVGLVALILFCIVLAFLGLLKKENLGILGYFSNIRSKPDGHKGKAGNFTRLVNERLSNSVLRHPALILIRCLGEGMAEPLIRRAENAAAFIPLIGLSTRGFVLLAGYGLVTGNGDLHLVSSFWLAGTFVVLLVQGRFFPFHFIPMILPTAILSVIGGLDLAQGVQTGETGPVILTVVIALSFVLDARFLLFKRSDLPLDLRYWPKKAHDVLIKNRIVKEASEYLSSHTAPGDEVLVWGTLPQVYVISDRKCPVNWLSTSATLMNQLFPQWEEVLEQHMKDVPPKYILVMDNDQSYEGLLSRTGHEYELKTHLGPEEAPLICLR